MVDFVTGDHQNVLRPGELLRSIHLPASALREAVRLPPRLAHPSRPLGGAADRHARRERRDLLLTITAATPRPVQLELRHGARRRPSCASDSTSAIPDDGYFDDVHGSPAYRKHHLTYYFAEQIRAELANRGQE